VGLHKEGLKKKEPDYRKEGETSKNGISHLKRFNFYNYSHWVGGTTYKENIPKRREGNRGAESVRQARKHYEQV